MPPEDEGNAGTDPNAGTEDPNAVVDPNASDDSGSDTDTEDEKDWKAEAEKWKKLSRQNEKNLRDTQKKVTEFENAGKSEAERLQEAAATHQTRAEKAEAALKRRELAEEFAPEHATLAQIKAVARRMSGESDDELEKDAKELFELIAPAPSRQPVPGKPKEKLRGGADPDDGEDGEMDPVKLAAKIPRAR
jgi:murein DD-endopeptidase MepM/ murein hydrolase activator NlpD